jgi:hypothetical protein
MSAGHEYEEVESIPWSALVQEARPRPLLAYVAGAVVVALALGLMASRTVFNRSPTPAPGTTTAPQQPPPTTPLAPAGDARLHQTPATYAEVALAEWFVTDYFTFDGDERRIGDLDSMLGATSVEPVVPAATYVEWARAWETAPTATGTDITVVFRTITATKDGFQRDPVRAVRVPLDSRPAGPPAVAGLPQPVEVGPARGDGVALPDQVPGPVAGEAIAGAGSWGEATVLGGIRTGETWSVVLMVADERGNAWPLSVEVPAGENSPE